MLDPLLPSNWSSPSNSPTEEHIPAPSVVGQGEIERRLFGAHTPTPPREGDLSNPSTQPVARSVSSSSEDLSVMPYQRLRINTPPRTDSWTRHVIIFYTVILVVVVGGVIYIYLPNSITHANL